MVFTKQEVVRNLADAEEFNCELTTNPLEWCGLYMVGGVLAVLLVLGILMLICSDSNGYICGIGAPKLSDKEKEEKAARDEKLKGLYKIRAQANDPCADCKYGGDGLREQMEAGNSARCCLPVSCIPCLGAIIGKKFGMVPLPLDGKEGWQNKADYGAKYQKFMRWKRIFDSMGAILGMLKANRVTPFVPLGFSTFFIASAVMGPVTILFFESGCCRLWYRSSKVMCDIFYVPSYLCGEIFMLCAGEKWKANYRDAAGVRKEKAKLGEELMIGNLHSTLANLFVVFYIVEVGLFYMLFFFGMGKDNDYTGLLINFYDEVKYGDKRKGMPNGGQPSGSNTFVEGFIEILIIQSLFLVIEYLSIYNEYKLALIKTHVVRFSNPPSKSNSKQVQPASRSREPSLKGGAPDVPETMNRV
jgi:hypothetical protein